MGPVRGGIGRRRVPALRRQPESTSRYRDRHSTSGAKSTRGCQGLADMVRTDRHNHRPSRDSDNVEAIRYSRVPSDDVWSRGRQVNLLRSTLREFYRRLLSHSVT